MDIAEWNTLKTEDKLDRLHRELVKASHSINTLALHNEEIRNRVVELEDTLKNLKK